MLIHDPSSRKSYPILKGVVLFHFIGCAVNHFTQFHIGNHRQQKDRAHHTPQRVKCLVETVFPARGAQLAQEHRWQHAPFLDRDDHLEQVLPVGLNQVPVNDVVVKEGIEKPARHSIRTTTSSRCRSGILACKATSNSSSPAGCALALSLLSDGSPFSLIMSSRLAGLVRSTSAATSVNQMRRCSTNPSAVAGRL